MFLVSRKDNLLNIITIYLKANLPILLSATGLAFLILMLYVLILIFFFWLYLACFLILPINSWRRFWKSVASIFFSTLKISSLGLESELLNIIQNYESFQSITIISNEKSSWTRFSTRIRVREQFSKHSIESWCFHFTITFLYMIAIIVINWL